MVSSLSDGFDSVSDDEELVEEEIIEEVQDELEEEEEEPEEEEEVDEEEIEEEEEVEEVEEVEEIEEEEVEDVEEEAEEVVEVEEEVEEVEERNESDGLAEEVEKIVEKEVEVVGEEAWDEEAEDVDMEIDEPDNDEWRLGEDKKNGGRCGMFEHPDVIPRKNDEEQAHGELQGLKNKISEIDGTDARFNEKPSEQGESCLIYAGKSPLNEACGDHISHKGSDCSVDNNKVSITLNGVEEESSSNFTMRAHPPEHFLIASMETSRKRRRSQTPVANRDNRDEGSSSMVCVYFAKGWCVKGNSCRFLHLKDGVVGIREQIKGDLSSPRKRTQLLDDEGSKREIERPRSSASIDELVFPTTGGHTNSKLIQKALVRTYGGDDRVSSPSINDYNKLLVRGELSRTPENPIFKEKFGPLYEFDESHPCRTSISPNLYADERRPHGGATFPGILYSFSHYPPSTNAAKQNVLEDLSPSTSLRMHFKPDSWEPSQPFRSSFLSLSANISSPESQYDPLLDSFDPKIAVAGTSRISNVPVSLSLRKQQINTSIYQEEKNIPIHNSFFRADDRIPADASEDASSGTAATIRLPKVDGSNSISKEERGSNLSVGGHSMESKAVRIFRAVLVDYIKDLVKPFWRGGQLSKDSHKLVIKKAVEKVFRALQPHQIPDSIESVNQYLSSSRAKLTKLVEAYVGKYSKAGGRDV